MKCRACWANSATRAPLRWWKALIARSLLVVPIQCRHCFHTFFVPVWMADPASLGGSPGIVEQATLRPGFDSVLDDVHASRRAA